MRSIRLTFAGLAIAIASAAVAEPSFVPVLTQNFPDAFVLAHGSEFIAYSTNDGANVPVAVSRNLRQWTVLTDPSDPKRKYDALPRLGSWAKVGFTWAPEVTTGADTKSYVMYFVARDSISAKQCIGVATSASPEGPFVDGASTPLVCQVAQGGTIDASAFRDSDGSLYLAYKNDGNCCGMTTTLYAQALSADGLSLLGTPVALLTNEPGSWEGAVIEAPTLWRHAGRLLLFYSANDYGGASYAVGYAECTAPLGRCRRAPDLPLLKSRTDVTPALIGPGHQTLFSVGTQTYMAYHAWQVTADGRRGTVRFLYIDRVDWDATGRPVVRGPTLLP